MALRYEQIEQLLTDIRREDWEPGLDVYKEHLLGLNQTILASGVRPRFLASSALA